MWENGHQLKEKRFKDGARLCRKLAMEVLAQVVVISKSNDAQKEKLKFKEYKELWQRADILYGYSFIYQSINEPFRTSMPETLFNISRFLLARILEDPPRRVSLVNILVTLAKHSEQLGKAAILIYIVH
jgi:intraflagellar transport protein 122